MSLSISLLIPVYNEAQMLNDVLDRLFQLPRVNQFIAVDDGSKDDSAKILKERLKTSGNKLRVVTHPKNRGKGGAIQSGIAIAETDYLVIHDADNEYQPSDLDKVFDVLEKKEADVVYGSRFLQANPNIYPTYLLGNKILTSFINLFGHGHLTDSYTCTKGMSVRHWRELELESNGFEIEAEISMKVLRSGWIVKEIPVTYTPRTFEEGKKIRPSDALKGMLKALECRYRS